MAEIPKDAQTKRKATISLSLEEPTDKDLQRPGDGDNPGEGLDIHTVIAPEDRTEEEFLQSHGPDASPAMRRLMELQRAAPDTVEKEEQGPAESIPIGSEGIDQATIDEQTLQAPFIDPVIAGASAGAAATKLAVSAGASLIDVIIRGVTAAGVTAVFDYPIGAASEKLAENHPVLAIPFNITLGILSGGSIERVFERGLGKGAKAVYLLLKARRAQKIAEGLPPADAARRALEEIVVESAQKDPEGLLRLTEDAKTFRDEMARRTAQEGTIPQKTTPGSPQGPGDAPGAPVTKKTEEAFQFYSPNIDENIPFEKAVQNLDGQNISRLEAIAQNVDETLGLNVSRKKGVGVWKNGAEEFFFHVVDNPPDLETVNYSLAWKGRIANQKAVLSFVAEDGGQDTLYQMVVGKKKGDLQAISRILEEEGIRFKTLVPEGNKTRVVVFDEGTSLENNVESVAKRLGVKFTFDRGRGGFIGGETRAEGLQAFSQEIESYERAFPGRRHYPGVGEEGESLRSVGPTGPKTAKPVKPRLTRVKSGTEEEIKAFLDTDPTAIHVGDKALKINWENIGAQDDVERVINRVTTLYEGSIDAARRGKVTDKEVKRLAQNLNMSLEDFLSARKIENAFSGGREGRALNAEQTLAMIDVLGSSARRLSDLSLAVAAGDPDAVQPMLRQLGFHKAIQEVAFGARAEAGRALRVWGMDADGNVAHALKVQDTIDTAAELAGSFVLDSAQGVDAVNPQKLAKMIQAIPTQAQLAKFARDASRPGMIDMLQEIWINSILSGPQTHAVNFLGNTLTLLYAIPERSVAARIGDGSVKSGEATAMLYGLITSFQDGMRVAWKALSRGERTFGNVKLEGTQSRSITSENVAAMLPPRGAAFLEPGGIPARAVDFLGEITRVPGRLLMTSDEFFKLINYRAELHALAYRTARGEGLEGDAMARRMIEVIDSTPKSIKVDAENMALYRTFTNDLGGFGQRLQNLSSHPAGKLIMPFVRTPVNIFKYTLERTPLAPLMKSFRDDIAAGGARRDMALAKISLGSMMMATVASLSASGFITGGGPKDPALRRQLRDTGWQPYSIKIGNKYFAYNRLDPIGMPIGMTADFTESVGDMDEVTAEKIGLAIAAAAAKNMTSKTYLRGVAGHVAAVTDPDKNLAREARNLAGSFVPASSLVSQVNRAVFDPTLREVRTMLDAVRAKIPGLSDDLPPRRNLFGEPIILGGGFGPDAISPIYTSERKVDEPVSLEIARLGAPIGMPDRSIEGVELNPHEYDRFVVLAGNEIKDPKGNGLKESLAELFESKAYKRSSDAVKERRLRFRVRAFRKLAREKMVGDPPFKEPESQELSDLVNERRKEEREALRPLAQ